MAKVSNAVKMVLMREKIKGESDKSVFEAPNGQIEFPKQWALLEFLQFFDV
ncbi:MULTISPECIES: hypothetical protein [Paenibacillus]|uniref:Uncharacterized protein n=1 Tax=Paenibacillus albilobatus TaxID=2716884 RepID=A0A919XBQ2_9BACL|nr:MULTISPECIES: hypothetical protein [Paenibacillus]GIO29721.1 hypothetical protein J2TS6_08620 [Paenibacillus albilobatus]